MPVLGVTGGIATGKTAFTGCLTQLTPGLRLFDSDRCARELTDSDPAIRAAIRDRFGPGVFDAAGTLKRPLLRAMVFADPVKRKALEAILHPAIRLAWTSLAGTIREQPGKAWLVVDIPLLFETSAESQFDKITVVACAPATQRRRLIEGRGVEPGLAESMIASQMPLAEKIGRADFVVWNDGLAQALEAQAQLLAGRLFS